MPCKSLSLCMAQLWASYRIRRQGRGRECREDTVRAEVHDDRNEAVDAPSVLPLPSSIFRFHHQQSPSSPSPSVKVHICSSSSEKSATIGLPPSALPSSSFEVVEEHKEHFAFDVTARTTLLRPMETTTDPGSGMGLPPLRTSIKEHLVAMRVSDNELVDHLRISAKTREIGQPWTTLSQEARRDEGSVETQQSLLAVLALDPEEESQMNTLRTAPVHKVMLPPLGPPFGPPLGPPLVPPLKTTLGRQSGHRRKRS